MAVKLPEDGADFISQLTNTFWRLFVYKYIQYLAYVVHRAVFCTPALSEYVYLIPKHLRADHESIEHKFQHEFRRQRKKQPKNMVDNDTAVLGISRKQRTTHKRFYLDFHQY